MTEQSPKLIGVYLFVADLKATKTFYDILGLQIEHVSDVFGRAIWGDEVVLEFGTKELTISYDPNFEEPDSSSKSTMNFELSSASAVDDKFGRLTELGYVGHLSPIDAPWQARFAIVEDPDGNFVGLHSPRDRTGERKRESSNA